MSMFCTLQVTLFLFDLFCFLVVTCFQLFLNSIIRYPGLSPTIWATWSSWRCPCSWHWGWTRWPFKVPSNPNCYMILWFYMRKPWFNPLSESDMTNFLENNISKGVS